MKYFLYQEERLMMLGFANDWQIRSGNDQVAEGWMKRRG